MGISDQIVYDERLQRKLRIIAEAERGGSAVVRASEEKGHFQATFSRGGAKHFYGEGHIQGSMLEGLLTKPGEHHAILPCSVPAPAVFVCDRKAWWSNDTTLAWSLQHTEHALGLGKKDWDWYRKSRAGKTYYRAEWCAQLVPREKGAHLVVRGLQPDAFDEVNLVGMAFFQHVAWALQTAIQNAPAGPPQKEICEMVYDRIALHFFEEDGLWSPPPAPSDATDALMRALAPLAGDRVTMGALPPKRAELVRRALTANLPVLGVLGDAGVLTPTQVLVITPTHGFLAFEKARMSFAWSEITNVSRVGAGGLFLETERLGWVPIPDCGKADALANAFTTLVQ
jgi:hypothetical protein